MAIRWAPAIGLLTFLCLAALSTAQLPSYWGTINTGDATYYGAGQDYFGHCSLNSPHNSLSQPWTAGVNRFVALNNDQYYEANAVGCGMCIMMWLACSDPANDQNSCGQAPGGWWSSHPDTAIPTTPTLAMVNNRCPECCAGNLDQSIDNVDGSGGRWKIKWYPVPCPGVGGSPFQYNFQSLNPSYMKLQVTNHKVPVSSLQILVNGNWMQTSRTPDNYFLLEGVSVNFPTQVQLTSIFGDTVIDTVPDYTGGVGSTQFPDHDAPIPQDYVPNQSGGYIVPNIQCPATYNAAAAGNWAAQNVLNIYAGQQTGGPGDHWGTDPNQPDPNANNNWGYGNSGQQGAGLTAAKYLRAAKNATKASKDSLNNFNPATFQPLDPNIWNGGQPGGLKQHNEQCGGLAASCEGALEGNATTIAPWCEYSGPWAKCESGLICHQYDEFMSLCKFPEEVAQKNRRRLTADTGAVARKFLSVLGRQ